MIITIGERMAGYIGLPIDNLTLKFRSGQVTKLNPNTF